MLQNHKIIDMRRDLLRLSRPAPCSRKVS